MNHDRQLWGDSEERRTRCISGNEHLQISRKLQTPVPDTPDFREKVNDPSGCVGIPPCQARIKTQRVVVMWVFVQIVDLVMESALEKED